MSALTIHQAAETTGWSPRMLRYVEQAGLVAADRSPAGYRLYGPEHLQRLRTLRELLEGYGVSLTEVGFAARLRTDTALAAALERWFTAPAARPTDVPAADWLRWEQEKHQRLLGLLPSVAVPSVAVPSVAVPSAAVPAVPSVAVPAVPETPYPSPVKETA